MSAAARPDFQSVAHAALALCPALLHRWFPAGRIRGREFVIGDLSGNKGDSLSINLDTGRWADFAGSARGGDLVALFAAMHRTNQGEAASKLAEELALPSSASVRRGADVIPMPKRGGSAEYHPIMPVPADAPPPPSEHPKFGPPEHVAHIMDQDGRLLHLIYRIPATGDRRKQIAPLSYGPDPKTGEIGWNWKAPPVPRPLYGLPIAENVPVLVVEGEMKRDAAERMLGGRAAVVSWPNGAQGIGRADWSPLRGRKVLMWPDADTPGREAAAAVVNVLRGVAASVRVVTLPDCASDGWDLADAERDGWTGDMVWNQMLPPSAPSDPDPEGADWHPAHADGDDEWPFRCLGHDHGAYFFLPRGAGQVVKLTAKELHSAPSLVALAPRRWWEGAFPGKENFSTAAAGNALIRACEQSGIYDPDRLRGRGVWLDDGRTVLHLGDHMLVDGQETATAAFRSKSIYEAGRPMDIELGTPLGNREAAELLEICRLVSWEDKDRDGRLLAGWLVVAMVCGAMRWRPHLWITSAAGSGKSWVFDNVVRPVLGPMALQVQGKTSEAGIRGALRLDARPVIFDEAETQNDQDRARMQQVLDLARAASTEEGADIIKGTKDGGSVRYRIRSCFAFASVNLGISQAADESRTVTLHLAQPTNAAQAAADFEKLKALHARVMVPGFPEGLLARTLSLLPTIRKNSDMLATAIARDGVSRRTGDTLGVVLAGAYSLTSRKVMTPEDAEAFLRERDWVRKTANETQAEPEWQRALALLMQVEAPITNGNGRTEKFTVSEMVGSCMGQGNEARGLTATDADTALRRMGLRWMSERLLIGYRSTSVTRTFERTPWATGWAATLARAPDAERNVPVRFTPAYQDKCVAIPKAALLRGEG